MSSSENAVIFRRRLQQIRDFRDRLKSSIDRRLSEEDFSGCKSTRKPNNQVGRQLSGRSRCIAAGYDGPLVAAGEAPVD
jgi:hypothetical protein